MLCDIIVTLFEGTPLNRPFSVSSGFFQFLPEEDLSSGRKKPGLNRILHRPFEETANPAMY